jgi:membrane complex biogenesis BtpA family protein
MHRFYDTFGKGKILIGVIHLAPLPGSPGYAGSLSQVLDRALSETDILVKEGFGAVIVENYGDLPFLKDRVGPETVASMAIVARELRRAAGGPVGINVLRNDYGAALAVAAASDCEFVRINVLTGAFATPEGIIEGRPGQVLRVRQRVGPNIVILADVMVKHAYPLAAINIDDNAMDVVERGGADGIVITGTRTGSPPPVEDLSLVRSRLKEAGAKVPVLIGSGVTPTNAKDFLKLSDGFIIGSYIREDGRAGEPIDQKKARQIANIYKQGAE